MKRHRPFRLLVHVELKDIRPRIMACNIQVVFAPDYLRAIDLGDQDLFALHVRSGKKIAERIDNTAAAATNDYVRIFSNARMIIGRKSRRWLN